MRTRFTSFDSFYADLRIKLAKEIAQMTTRKDVNNKRHELHTRKVKPGSWLR